VYSVQESLQELQEQKVQDKQEMQKVRLCRRCKKKMVQELCNSVSAPLPLCPIALAHDLHLLLCTSSAPQHA